MSSKTREELGRLVRETWIAWAKEQPNPKPSWLVPWEELSEPDKEVDRQIGEAVRAHVEQRTIENCAAIIDIERRSAASVHGDLSQVATELGICANRIRSLLTLHSKKTT